MGRCSSRGRAASLIIGGSLVRIPAPPSCMSNDLEHDTEPQIAPDEQLAPCMTASSVYE